MDMNVFQTEITLKVGVPVKILYKWNDLSSRSYVSPPVAAPADNELLCSCHHTNIQQPPHKLGLAVSQLPLVISEPVSEEWEHI